MKIELDTSKQVIVVNGVGLSFALLEFMTNPNPAQWVRYVRDDGDLLVCYKKSDEVLK